MPYQMRIDPILPQRDNYPLDLVERLEAEMTKLIQGPIRTTLVNGFWLRMRGWKNRPEIRAEFNRRAYKGNLTGFALTVKPYGQNLRYWAFVTLGTRPHIIMPKGSRQFIRIRGGISGYRPRTMPGDYFGGPGDYADEDTFWTTTAAHPGIEARQFEKAIVKQHEKEFVDAVIAAANRAFQ